jgi:preprotein translocase subunit YajC
MNLMMTIFAMSPAPAAGAGDAATQQPGLFGGYQGILVIVLIFAVMWLLMIRPQQKQQKELARFRNSLEKGVKVVTAGGIHGTVREVHANTVTLQVDKDVTIEVDKTMIMRAPGA